jgi:hypothetical protein
MGAAYAKRERPRHGESNHRRRAPGAPRLVVLLTTPAVAEDVAAECAAAGVPPASGSTAPRPGSMLKKAVACHREHGIALIPARSGSAATVAMCNRHNEGQMRSPTVLPIDGCGTVAPAGRVPGDAVCDAALA